MPEKKVKADALKATLQSMEPLDEEIEIVIRLSNTSTRALHYISDLRTRKYDPATKTLTLGLSDDGRELISTYLQKLPEFKFIDPESEAEIRLKLPNRIVKLSRSAPPGELAFETQDLSEVENIVIDIAWADVPYYVDTREKDDERFPTCLWQQHKAQAKKRIKGGRGKKG